MSGFSPENMTLKKEAEDLFRKIFEKYGCKYFDNAEIPPELTNRVFTDPEIKKAFAIWLGDKYDFIVKKGDLIFVDAKCKTRDAFKNIVNVVDYDALWRIAQCGVADVYLYIWVKENNKFYKHKVTFKIISIEIEGGGDIPRTQ